MGQLRRGGGGPSRVRSLAPHTRSLLKLVSNPKVMTCEPMLVRVQVHEAEDGAAAKGRGRPPARQQLGTSERRMLQIAWNSAAHLMRAYVGARAGR